MPQPNSAPNQPVATQGDYSNFLQKRINSIENQLAALYPNDGTTFVPGGDIDLQGNDILNGGSITCDTLNYTTLNPPVGGSFLPLAGGTMAGDIDMDASRIRDARALEMSSGVGTAPSAGIVSLFQDDGLRPRYTNSTELKYTIANTDELAAYLPLAGGTMLGALDMGSQEIINVSAVRTIDTNAIFGNGASASGPNSVSIGQDATSAEECVVIGQGASTQGNSTCLAIGNSSTNSDPGGVALGHQASAGLDAIGIGRLANAAGDRSIVIGQGSSASSQNSIAIGETCISTADSADIIGTNISNNIANSLIIGTTDYVNIRPASGTCDLGTTLLPFVDAYLSNVIASAPSAISILSTTVTAINYIVGTTLVDLPGFTQLQNPHSDFAFALGSGQITYLGVPTRYFRVTINFSHVGMAGAPTVYHYISKNGSLVLAGERTKEVPGADTGAYVSFCLTGIVQLATGNTIQLAVNNSAGTPAVDYDAVSYCITQA